MTLKEQQSATNTYPIVCNMKLVDYLRQKLHVCVVVDPTHDILNFVIEYLCKNCFMESLKQQIEVENLVTLSPNKNINLNLFQGDQFNYLLSIKLKFEGILEYLK